MNEWPLVGRAAELAAIFDRLDREPPVAVVIGGAAGVGKSRLLREVARTGRGAGLVDPLGRRDERGGVRSRSARWSRCSPAVVGGLVVGGDVAHAKRALSAADGDPPHLLVVDDAQRLDAGSATLVHQVVVEGVCRTVATVRSGEPAPDAIASLWTSGRADRIELAGLSLAETGELLDRRARWPRRRGRALAGCGRRAAATCCT